MLTRIFIEEQRESLATTICEEILTNMIGVDTEQDIKSAIAVIFAILLDKLEH